jgi:hypothetical protein
MTKYNKKLQKDITGYVGTGMLLGVGTKVVGAAGSPASASAIGGMGKWMSPMATVSGAGAAMGSLQMLQPKGKKKSKW